MDPINITVHCTNPGFQIAKGTPAELGLPEISSHIVLCNGQTSLRLWLVGTLTSAEKQNLTQGALAFLDQSERFHFDWSLQ